MMGITNTELLLIDHLVKKGRIYHRYFFGFLILHTVLCLSVFTFFVLFYFPPILGTSSMNNALFVLTF